MELGLITFRPGDAESGIQNPADIPGGEMAASLEYAAESGINLIYISPAILKNGGRVC